MTRRIALVSGGTGALGTAICRALHHQGRAVIALGHPTDAPRMDAWQQANLQAECEIRHHLVDVADYEACSDAIRVLQADVGPIEILVNAAGITRDASLRKLRPEDWRAVMATNLDSVYNLSQLLIDGMLDNGFGRIVNISSVNGRKGQFGQTNYSAAKAGMHGFTMALAQEVARKGITVNTVSPGYIDSPMIRQVPEAIRDRIRESIPAGRFGQPEDIARTVAFLTAEEAGYVTGAELAVNGGLHMH